MGSLSLECPLCCSEKFTSFHGLKYHLLALLERLNCSACSRKFSNVRELIDHLDLETCGKGKSPIKKEEEDVEDCVQKSILAKALLKKSEEEAMEVDGAVCEVDDEVESDAESEDGAKQEQQMYECSTCEVQFTSVEEHIREFHAGTEVVLQNVDDESVQDAASEDQEDTTLDALQDSDSQEDDPTTTTTLFPNSTGVIKNEFPQILNTVQQKECLDKDGLVYTRKIVKIEKFWNESGGNDRPPPILNTYIVGEDGKVIEIEDVEGVEGCDSGCTKVYHCPVCLTRFTNVEFYYKHRCAGKTKEHKCNKCEGVFTSARGLKIHLREHNKVEEVDADGETKESFMCEECNTEFPSYKSLRLHKRMHEPIKSREVEAPVSYGINGTVTEEQEGPREMFICQLCNKTYDKRYEEAHMDFHKTDNYDCDICNRKFYTKSNLEMHMRVHSNGKKFSCSYCKKGFLTYENLQEHVKNQCQRRKYECQYCGRRFSRPHEKVKHERIHTGEKPHVCGICGKAFRVSYCLTLHMRTHSGTRPYQCPYCSKRFKAHSVFNHHLLTHSDVRAYKCPYCPKAFKTGVQLAGHKNSHIKPFTCTQCNRPFASLYAVRAHMETHKRENNLKFICWTCGASYARAFALKDHIREHHGEEAVVGVEEATNSIVQQEGEEVGEEVEQTVLVTLEEAPVEDVQVIAVAE